jgi:prepilin-type N-terminal cleavage/methylation domain-containing protein
MKTPTCYQAGRPPVRSGFTLVELLVVIAIIAVLAALLAAGISQVIDNQKQSNTEQTIRVVSKALKQKWEAVVADARKEPVPVQYLNMAGGDTNRAQIIWIKFRLKQAFPMNFAEAFAPTPLDWLPEYYETLTQFNVGPSQPPQPYESAACLLLALRQQRSGTSFDPDILGSGAVATTYNGVTVPPYFIDGWGNPLGFARWPAIAELDGLNPTGRQKGALYLDPGDPDALLMSAAWWQNDVPDRTQFEGWCHLLSDPTSGSAVVHNRVPIIYSTGRNPSGFNPSPMYVYGTELANFPTDQGFIYSYRLRTGARGD